VKYRLKLNLGAAEAGDDELPFAFMLITLMASCGVSPYESFKRLRHIELLPFVKKESDKIVRQVEVLNKDPLTAMLHTADQTESEAYGDFLRGYVSTVKSGGSVTSYLKSKLRSVFEVRAVAAVRSIERLETLVESYMIMLLVLLCVYILVAVMSSATFTTNIGMGISGGQIMVYLILFVVMPSASLFFMLFAQILRKGTLMGLRSIYFKALPFVVVSGGLLAALVFVPGVLTAITNVILSLQTALNAALPGLKIPSLVGNTVPLFVTVCLVFVSLVPSLTYKSIIGVNMKAEDSMPSFLRDVSETRKTGMSPEKSIVHSAGRKGYGSFSKILERIVNQIEWGVSLRKIYTDLQDWLKSWPVLTNFLILIETIEVGGGSPEALELLAGYSERLRDIEKSKREMLRPYVVLPFIWTVLMALTFTFTFYVVTLIPTGFPGESGFSPMGGQIALFSCAIIFLSWVSGFFIGKVTQGSFAAGFEYSLLLAVTAFLSLLISQNIINIIFGAL
jgi:flagellar protein FlaJ